MKSTELRIGNLLRYTDYTKVKEQLRGTPFELTADDILFLSENSVHYVDPIQLTEEWLIKFGFKKVQEDKYGCHYENKECWIYLTQSGFEIEIITASGRFNLSRTYKYVHQLQNLYFAITCKELEVI